MSLQKRVSPKLSIYKHFTNTWHPPVRTLAFMQGLWQPSDAHSSHLVSGQLHQLEARRRPRRTQEDGLRAFTDRRGQGQRQTEAGPLAKEGQPVFKAIVSAEAFKGPKDSSFWNVYFSRPDEHNYLIFGGPFHRFTWTQFLKEKNRT